MLGEIIKSTEALRFHAKSAEIAGQNLAHVNDESYARQRVLAREGLMHKGQGGLNTSSLDAGGLEHARNELLDKRVFTEFAESSNLETQKEILSLLQSALGESIDRQALGGGLDIDLESNLAAGGLARALDDLFNAFQELSASPDESTAKEDIVNKVKTLTKRFNDAGQSLDRIDADLTTSMENSVKSVNTLLEQIYEVNLQIKRFELLGQGKAVSYRDKRQTLLEDLSKLIDFKIEPEINDGRETGFWNIKASAKRNLDMFLVSADGVTSISKDFGGIIEFDNAVGKNAQVRAKITGEGKLGHVEVLNGGSQYDDSRGPILFSLPPAVSPIVLDGDQGTADESYSKGSVFSQDGKFYQSLKDTLIGADLSDENSFIEIVNFPANGQLFEETVRRYSDLESFEKGEQIYYEGKLYQAIEDFGTSRELKLDDSNLLQTKLSKGEIIEFNDKFFQALESKQVGTQINSLGISSAEFGDEIDGFLALGNTPPHKIDQLSYVPSSVDNTRPDRWFLSESYQQGDYVKFGDNYFQFLEDTYQGTELDNLARSMQALPYDQTRNYQVGDFIELEGLYYEFTKDFAAFADTNEITDNLASTEPFGMGGRIFDGVLQQVENPNRFYVESNGSYKISDAFREFQLSELSGSEQSKQIRISGISGDQSDVFNFEISLGDQKVIFNAEAGEDDPSLIVDGFGESFSQDLRAKLLEVETSGSVNPGTLATDPAFDVIIDEATGDLLISGVAGLGEFTISATLVDNEPIAEEEGGVAPPNVAAEIQVITEREYLADKYTLVFSSDEFEDQIIDVSYIGDNAQTASAIAEAVSKNEVLNQKIGAIVIGESVTFRANDEEFEFSVDLSSVEDLHNQNTNQIKISTETTSSPIVSQTAVSNTGKPAINEIDLSNIEAFQSFDLSFSDQSDFSQPYELQVTLGETPLSVSIERSDDPRTKAQLLSNIEDKLLEIEQDGTIIPGSPAVTPAFVLDSDFENGSIKISADQNTGNFSIISIDIFEGASVTNISESFNLFLRGEEDDRLGGIEVQWQGNAEDTATEIKRLIDGDDTLNNLVQVELTEGSPVLTLTGVKVDNGTVTDEVSNFESLEWEYVTGGAFSEFSATRTQSREAPINQVDQISGLGGIEQAKKYSFDFVQAAQNEGELPISIILPSSNDPITLPLEEGEDPLDPDLERKLINLPAPVDNPLEQVRFDELVKQLRSINADGTLALDSENELIPSTNPAFTVDYDFASSNLTITGNENIGDFVIEEQIFSEDHPYLSDEFLLEITDDTDATIGSITVPQVTDARQNAEAIVNAINNDENLKDKIDASVNADNEVIIAGNNPSIRFTTNLTVKDNLNSFTAQQLEELDQSKIAYLQQSGAKIARIERSGIDTIGAEIEKVQSLDFKRGEEPMSFKQNDIYYFANQEGGFTHFVVTAPTAEIDADTFDPLDPVWENNFKIIKPQLLDANDPSLILRKAFPSGHNLENGSLVELNIGLAEAVIKKGEITGFNILNSGNGLPSTDSLFAGGMELEIESGSIKGLKDSRSIHLEKFRNDLNDLVSTFVEEINSIYNPDDQPGAYMFGFDAILTRPVSGRNLLLEEEYGLAGREGDASITLYRDEVDMTLPHSQSENFSIVNTTPIFPEEFEGQTFFARGGENAELTFRGDNAGESISFYASASRMQNVTMENDDSYPGADLANGTSDDGRSLMMAYETIPFRLEGLEEGAKLPVIGDNFTFTALPSNPWNLATSLKVDHRFNSDSLDSGNSEVSGSNEIALAIAEMGDDNYIEQVSLLNANIGNNISDLKDNLEHQESIETFLLDQRRAVSSVSIDEEVADLMRFQRSFQASSRVLSTLDKMLEIVVMGLVR